MIDMKTSFVAKISIILLVLATLAPTVEAANEMNDRNLTLSSSVPSQSTNYTFNFSVEDEVTPIQSFESEICTTASGACVVPSGFDAGSANLINQPSGFGSSSGWSVDTSNADVLRMNNDSNTTAPNTTQSVTFGSVVNPETPNETFYARITTYENDDYTDEIDTGVVAASTGEGVEITGFVPPILTFCVGVEISGDCSTVSGDSIDLGTFSPNTTSSGTSQMRASTNAGDGYVITVEGGTLASGSNTIDALTSPTPSQTEQSQFGLNLRENANPEVGEDVSGDGSGEVEPDYNIVDEFVFNAGDAVASSTGPTNANTYTASYITNIEPQQAAGNYSTTLTYIATATF